MTVPLPTGEEIERGRLLFAAPCDFVAGATEAVRFPPADLPEVAFAGRSNVGKSSLINALTNRKGLARASNTPGRTQQLNFFDLGGRLTLVDLPGYGFAQESREKSQAWNELVANYLKERSCLRTVCVLVDGRHGFKVSDNETMNYLDECGVSYAIILTKADKLKETEALERQTEMEALLKKHRAAFPRVIMTSSGTGKGIEALRAHLGGYAIEKRTR